MFVIVYSAAVIGLQATLVTVEVDISPGWPGFQIVGLPDAAIQEAKERIRVAWKNSGFAWPHGKGMTVNLAPASVRKEGAWFDLPMAIGMCAAEFGLDGERLSKTLIVGELALDGTVRAGVGILPVVRFAREQGYSEVLVPIDNQVEASLVSGVKIIPVASLKAALAHLKKVQPIAPTVVTEFFADQSRVAIDFSDVAGQEMAKRGLEIAAAGGHNVLFSGPPGSGKTMLARALPGILPPLTTEELLEVGTIYSVSGQIVPGQALTLNRPFRSPHHSASAAALVGGGQHPRPGEISLAHCGVLFLDELPEFPQTALEALRQPLEDGHVTIARAHYTLDFPARVLLVASQNPCPCGYATDPERACVCSPVAVANYRKKISGPLLDRIDMHIQVPRLDYEKIQSTQIRESSALIRERVVGAHQTQQQRQHTQNSGLSIRAIRAWRPFKPEVEAMLEKAHHKFQLTGRGLVRVLRLARTIADLAKSNTIESVHVSEALLFRCGTV